MENKNTNETSVLKSFSKSRGVNGNKIKIVLASLLVVMAGVGTGWFLSGSSSGKGPGSVTNVSEKGTVNSQDEAGVADESTFSKSEAPVGILQSGGLNGEGNFHLERPGGSSQNVYLTSTVIDLQSFVGKKVQVWGETLSSQKAGWLMDVGKIKVVK